MAFSFDEIPGSRTSTDVPPSATRKYRMSGEFDSDVVEAYARAAIPGVLFLESGAVYRQSVNVEEAGFKLYTATAQYGPNSRETGSMKISFDTTGGTVNVKASKETVNSYPAGATDHKQAISVDATGNVGGADVVIPALKLTVSFRHPIGNVDIGYMRKMARNTGKMNSTSFLGFDAGEVLFLGATGSEGTDCESEVSYQFACSENLRGLTIGAITGITKRGWDIAWIAFQAAIDAGKPATQPQYVYVERVYDSVNLGSLLGFGR